MLYQLLSICDMRRLIFKKIFRSSLIICPIIWTSISCSNQETDNSNDCSSEQSIIESVNIISKGFAPSSDFIFDCDSIYNIDEAFYIINNESEFNDLIKCNQDSFDIDFDNQILIVGLKKLSWCCASPKRQEVNKNCLEKTYTYNVEVEYPEGHYDALSTFIHWVVIPDIPYNYEFKYELIIH